MNSKRLSDLFSYKQAYFLVGFLGLAFILLTWLSTHEWAQVLDNEIIRKGSQSARGLSRRSQAAVLLVDKESLLELVRETGRSDPDIVSAAIYDAGGVILAEADSARPLPARLALPRSGAALLHFEGDRICLEPIADKDGKPLGTAGVRVSNRRIVRTVRATAGVVVLFALSVWIVMGALLTWLMKRVGLLSRKERELRQSLIQSEKMAAVGQLAGGVAHEINNPLGIILGFAQSAVRRLKDGDALSLPLKSIEREATRCRNLVQNLLVFSRSSASEQRDDMDINGIIEESLSLVMTQCRVKGVEVLKELSGGLPRVRANKNQIQQIIINLGANALDAMPQGGILGVRSRAANKNGRDGLVFEISDNGIGIPENIKSKIFEPFFTTKEVGKGTGLGLSLVYGIVQQHQGSIEVASEAGRGTTFSVFLPKTDSPKSEPGQLAPSAGRSQSAING